MSRSLSTVGLVLAGLLLCLPPSTYAREQARGSLHSNSAATVRAHGTSHTGLHCAVDPDVRGSAAKHAVRRAGTLAGCAMSVKQRTLQSSRTRSLDSVSQLPAHAVGDIFGVGSFVTQRSWTVSPLVVRRARELGAGWVREEFTASRLHATSSGRYWWSDYDRIVNEERRAGIQVLGLLDYSNTWRFQDHGTMPHGDIKRLVSDFATYAQAVAWHFRGRIRYWQIWNEPNVETFWHPTPHAADYALLLEVAGKAIKRADRSAKIVLAGTSGIDFDFLRAVTARDRSFDVVAVHPYRSEPEPHFLAQVRELRRLHKPIWFSEIGWPAGDGCDRCYGEIEQERYLVRFYVLAAAAGIQRVFWYDLRDDPHSAANPEAHFGLLRRDLSAKPAFAAYAYLSHLLGNARYVGADWLGKQDLYVLRFRRGAINISVLWNTGNKNRRLQLRWHHTEADFITAEGEVLAQLTPDAGHVSVIAPQGGEPFYLVDRPPRYRPAQFPALLHFIVPSKPTHRSNGPVRTSTHHAPRPRRATHGARARHSAASTRGIVRRAGKHPLQTKPPKVPHLHASARP